MTGSSVGPRNTAKVAVSVVVMADHNEHLLERCVRSVVQQTFRDWELIIVGGGPTTLDVVRRARRSIRGQRIVTVPTPPDGGSRARNLGVTATRGQYVSCVAAGDFYHPTALDRLIAAFKADPSLAVVGSPAEGAQEEGGRPYSFDKLRDLCLVAQCALYRREAWEKVGGYDEGMGDCQDWDFWLSLGEAGYPMRCLDEALWSEHDAHRTVSSRRDLELRAQIVRGHPGVYRACCLRLAERITGGEVTDSDLFSCAHPIFAASLRAEAAVARAEAIDADAGDEPQAVLMPQPCLLAFRDCSARVGGIGWAQSDLLRWFDPVPPRGRTADHGLSSSVAVPAGTTIGDLLAAVGRVVARHESLRTRFHSAEDDTVRQEALGSGYVDVTRYRVRAGHTATDALLQARISDQALDIEYGHTFRAGFVADGDTVTHVAFALSRLIADATACENLVASLAAELSAVHAGGTRRTEPAFQQLDQVAWESSTAGVRAEHQAMDFWREELAAIRAFARPIVADGGSMRDLVAPAEPTLAAADELARAYRTSSSSVVLTAFLQAATDTLRLDGVGCYLSCSNRAGMGRRESITRLKNLAIYAYSPGGADFRSTALALFRHALTAYRHAQSPSRLLLPRLGADEAQGPFIWFNDVRSVVSPVDPAERTGEADRDPSSMLESLAEPSLDPYLSLNLGPVMGSGSNRPILRIETNLMSAADLPLLFERMNGLLATAVLTERRGMTP